MIDASIYRTTRVTVTFVFDARVRGALKDSAPFRVLGTLETFDGDGIFEACRKVATRISVGWRLVRLSDPYDIRYADGQIHPCAWR